MMPTTKERTSTITPSVSTVVEHYAQNFKIFEQSVNGDAGSMLRAVRQKAFERFSTLGFPTTKLEEWRYTDVSPIVRGGFTPWVHSPRSLFGKDIVERFTYGIRQCHRLVCVDGHFIPELSDIEALPQGVMLTGLATASKSERELIRAHLTNYARYEDDSFTALNTAFLHDGFFVEIPPNVIVDTPIHLLHIATAAGGRPLLNPRTLIIAGKNSQASLVETFVSLGTDAYVTNTVREIVLGENAVLEFDHVQDEHLGSFHIGTTQVVLARSSNFVSNAVILGGALVRNNVNAVLAGEGAEATLNGLYLGTGKQHIDNHTIIEHASPHCPSHELYKGILAGRSKGVFNGKIHVHKHAQKTDAKQTNKNLVLSDDASVDTKPQLEIYANDVRCTHGATIGQLDEEALYYLRSRGIGLGKARDILVYAFASEVIDRIRMEPMRSRLQHSIHDRLERERLYQDA